MFQTFLLAFISPHLKRNFKAEDKWYEHELESVLENKDYKIL